MHWYMLWRILWRNQLIGQFNLVVVTAFLARDTSKAASCFGKPRLIWAKKLVQINRRGRAWFNPEIIQLLRR